MMSEGWIKLHRKIRENPVLAWRPLETFVFVELLLSASHKPFRIEKRGHELELQEGQCCVSIRSWAKNVKVGHQVMRRVFDLFEKRHMIETETNTLGTIVTICNWGKYQSHEDDDNTAPTQQPTQHQHSTNTHNKNDKNLDSELNPTSEPSFENQNPMINTCSAYADRVIDFDQWWSCWVIPGTKRSRKKSKALYLSVVRRGEATHEQLCDGLKRYMVYCHRMGFGPDKIKHPTTWLNAGAWDDELVVSSTQGNGNGISTSEQLAQELAEQIERDSRFTNPDGLAEGSHGNGEGYQRHSQEGPGHRNQGHGRGLPEIPAGFDQGDGGWLED